MADNAVEERDRRTRELLALAADTTEPTERARLLDEVVVVNRPAARAVARRYTGRGVPVEDLEQAACEGLVKAVRRYDPAIGDLMSYAVPLMRGEVRRWFRDHGWTVRPPRPVQELQWQLTRHLADLEQELGREPTPAELRARLGCTPDELDAALAAYGAFRPLSLDQPLASGTVTTGDLLPLDDDPTADVDARVSLAPVVRRLGERERRILYLRFVEDQNQREIGEELGVSQVQVSRLLTRILAEMRAELEDGA
jgi:RNA polymerase sigma-B factor